MENIKSYVDRIWCSRHKSDVEQILIEYAQYKVNELKVLPKTRKCDWCKKRKSVEQGYWLGKFENKTKDWFICQECNLKHHVV